MLLALRNHPGGVSCVSATVLLPFLWNGYECAVAGQNQELGKEDLGFCGSDYLSEPRNHEWGKGREALPEHVGCYCLTTGTAYSCYSRIESRKMVENYLMNFSFEK